MTTSYLVIREGSKWTDVYRLNPGQVVTIGRAPTNQIVIKDDRCSRNHAEVFLSGGQWTLRDLHSRNGTLVGETPIVEDYPLKPGDHVFIGHSHMGFVNDLSKAFPDSSAVVKQNDETVVGFSPPRMDENGDVLEPEEPTTITHRRGYTRYLQHDPNELPEEGFPQFDRAYAKLYRLDFELWKATDIKQIAEIGLNGLLEETEVAAGGVLLLPRDFQGHPKGSDLQISASSAPIGSSYHQASDFLIATALGEGEAILARNVTDDSTIGTRDSKGVIAATSIICAPIRSGTTVYGVIHLYSIDERNNLDPDDLEFSLAVAESIAVAITNMRGREELTENIDQIKTENTLLREQLGVQSEIIGSSNAMQRVAQEISRAAPSRATVLIRGESGVGKELVARAIHYSSPRVDSPFVCLNCAALSESLLESELFGHEQGAFTGATERKMGKFEAADTGTLMLDEIGEMSPSVQAKFLRVLEGHPFERVGGTESIKVDVRVIAATNRDLEKEVSEGNFRRDLFFRLRVLEITVPALRKRPDDVNDLIHYFLRRFNEETSRKIRGFTPEASEQLKRYRWPGNVRELKNVIERAVVLSRGPYIDTEDLLLSRLSTAGDTAAQLPKDEQYEAKSLSEMERQHILATLLDTNWNKSQAAQILGIERSTLDRKIRRYELNEYSPNTKRS